MAEYDISAELEEDQVEYERKHKKDIRLSMLDEKTGKFIPFNKKKYLAINRKGWHREPIRHGLAAKGIRTALKQGIKVELEHRKTILKIRNQNLSVKAGAKLIAKDHLKEDPKYYEKLKKVEGVKKQ